VGIVSFFSSRRYNNNNNDNNTDAAIVMGVGLVLDKRIVLFSGGCIIVCIILAAIIA